MVGNDQGRSPDVCIYGHRYYSTRNYIRYSKKIKTIEVEQRERDRDFQLTKTISEKSVEILSKTYSLARTLNQSFASFKVAKEDEVKERIFRELDQARKLWEEDFVYLPKRLKDEIMPLMSRVSGMMAIADQKLPDSLEFELGVLNEISQFFEDIEQVSNEIMTKYNKFYEI